jgi:hemerythrin-like domain-containing protein
MSSNHKELHQALRQVVEAEQVRVAQLQRLGRDAEISRDILQQMEDALRRIKRRRQPGRR